MMTVLQQQCLLACLGYYRLCRKNGTLAIDGIGGPSTRSAIKRFQLEHRVRPDGTELWVDGVWGPATEGTIREVIAYDEPPQVETVAPDIQDVPKAVWDELLAQGLPPEAVAGIMGNIDSESNMSPINLEDKYEGSFTDLSYTEAIDTGIYTGFPDDHFGYGLCQWTWPTRKAALLRYSQDTGSSIGSAKMQIDFLIKELREMYPQLLSRLMVCKTVYAATSDFMINYENPFDKSDAAISRRNQASEMYYRRYRG